MRLLLWLYHYLRERYYHRLVRANHPDQDVTDAWHHHRERRLALD